MNKNIERRDYHMKIIVKKKKSQKQSAMNCGVHKNGIGRV